MTGPVLIAYDGSPGSATAIVVAGRLISERRAVVCHAWSGLSRAMLHADPAQLPGALHDAAAQLDQPDLEAAEKVAAEGARLASTAGFQATPLAVRERRKTWHALLDAAARSSASLVVTGAHRMSGNRPSRPRERLDGLTLRAQLDHNRLSRPTAATCAYRADGRTARKPRSTGTSAACPSGVPPVAGTDARHGKQQKPTPAVCCSQSESNCLSPG